MKLTFGIFITLFLTNNFIYGQKSLTKEEILKYWGLPSAKKNINSISIVNSDSTLNLKLLRLIDSLPTKIIDSVIVFSTAWGFLLCPASGIEPHKLFFYNDLNI
jgi:hypothetical protein